MGGTLGGNRRSPESPGETRGDKAGRRPPTTLSDSSVLIDYLDGVGGAVEYAGTHTDRRAVAPPLVLFEVYRRDVFESGTTDRGAVDGTLGWFAATDETADVATVAGELQDELRQRGSPLAPRDAYIAGAAKALDRRLAVADPDFDVDGIDGVLAVDVL